MNNRARLLTTAILSVGLITACSPNIQRNPVPESLLEVAHPKNMDASIRSWGDEDIAAARTAHMAPVI